MKRKEVLLAISAGVGLILLVVFFMRLRPSIEVDRFGIVKLPAVAAIPTDQRDAIYYEWRQDGVRRAKSWLDGDWAFDLDLLYEQRKEPESRDLFITLTHTPTPLAPNIMEPLSRDQWASLGLRVTIDLESVNEFRRLSPIETTSNQNNPSEWLMKMRKMANVVAVEALQTKSFHVKPNGEVIPLEL